MKYSTLESEYLTQLLRSALTGQSVPAVPTGLNWEELVRLAKKQQVYSMIAEVITKVDVPADSLAQLKLKSQNELLRLLAMKSELEDIEQELKANGVEYMLVKGSVIRNYYPKQKMRQMSDIDTLYKEKYRKKLLQIMKDRGYYLEAAQANSDDFFKPPYYTFEFHRSLFDEADDFCPDFDLWKRATPDEKNTNKFNISNEDMLIYSLCHMYDHLCISGCGIRFVCDLYVLLNALDNLDWDYIDAKITEFGFKDFCYTAMGLAKTLFMNGKGDSKQQELLDITYNGGVYGKSRAVKQIIDEDYNGSKLKYILRRLFPTKKQMYGNYPALENKHFLLPLYYLIRLIQKLKIKKSSIFKELKSIK